MSVTKKKRVSKKNKVSWRKHVNIDDVEDFLEDQRLDERLGHLNEKPSEELFEICTKPIEKKSLSKQEARALLRQKQPRCFELLQPLTQVPDPISKRNRVRTKEERKNELIKLKEKERRQKGILRSRELQAHIDRSLYKKELLEKRERKNYFKTDIWASESNQLNSEWIADETKQHILFTLNKHERRVPKTIRQKYSGLPSVEPPHPGTSYNPTLNDHRDLLHKVVEKETAIMKEERHIQRVTSDMFKRVSAKQKHDDWLVEMSQGLNNTEPNNEEGDVVSVNPPVENKKKTLKQRRKQKEQVKLALERNVAKKEKKKVTDLRELRLLKEELEKTEKKLEEEREKRLNKSKNIKEVPKQLGPIKFEEEEIDFNLPQDIMGSLRNLKKEGSLLLDRYKSLQKRNILQPTIRRRRKFAKTKRFKKSGHENSWKVTVARSKDNLL